MKYVIFIGSVRRERYGHHVAGWIAAACKERGHEVSIIDPLSHNELLYLVDQYKTAPSPSEDFTQLQQTVEKADAYIAITPEYNHGYSGALKSAIDCFLEEYNRKCFGIVTYSAGSFGGVRAAGSLREVCAEVGAVAIPTSLAISKVQDTVNAEGLQDEKYVSRLKKFLDELDWYAEAFKAKR